ncbi:hypothetical protein ACWDR1_32130 [Streptosporangium sandarakinum]
MTSGSSTRWASLSKAVAEAGLWDHLAPADRRAAADGVAAGGTPLDFDLLDGQVQFFADGERLAEGGVQAFLARIAPALKRYGLSLEVEVVTDPYEDDGGDYVLALNGTRCVIWTEQEVGDEGLWLKATVRPLAVVNELLEASGATARAHLLYEGGNEGLLLLLNPAVPAAMRASALFDEDDIPTLPTPGT